MSEQTTATDKATQESLISIHRWTDKLLTFRTTRSADYRFTPGQFARLGLLINGEMVWRAYSITSAEAEDQLEYYAIVVPGGLFTSALNQLQPGDPVWVEKLSYGFMTPDRFADGEDFWMLATGTGLGPYISILQQREVWQQFRHLILVHCVRHEEELTYQEKFETLRAEAAAQNLPAQLQLIRMTTRDDGAAQPDRLQGRITSALREGRLERAAGLAITTASSRLMVCGNPDMITEVREILKERGLGPCRRAGGGQFITEDYW
ncbi:ferredoxin--NADP reductase [Herbaspirillum rhizosphaerae]|uniref:ferredoxin--NADP reductase n=1 Tax=Herbaspirillum rhizosphaerae TaxID=346179 RepID=UPI00067B208A|nr:ferredoxin--NADP reductase [Herbaspirillum rhizosphaerae]